MCEWKVLQVTLSLFLVCKCYDYKSDEINETKFVFSGVCKKVLYLGGTLHLNFQTSLPLSLLVERGGEEANCSFLSHY